MARCTTFSQAGQSGETPPGGGARIDQTSFIQKIEVEGTPSGPWKIRLGVSPV
jgi:hypothetical protein